MKRRIALMLVLGLLGSLWPVASARAQIDAFTFFVPYSADSLRDAFVAMQSVTNPTWRPDQIVTTVSISVLRDNTTIYYDHWEDGLEPNITLPTQSTTEVLSGLSAGQVIPLQSDVTVPRNDPPDIFYDGGDKIVSEGGSIAVTVTAWPEPLPNPALPGILFAGAWELCPTNHWGTDYVIPVGVNLSALRGGFTIVGFSVQAVEDDTVVEIRDPISGFQDTVTRHQGQQYTLVNGVNAGTTVHATKPVQVHLFTGDPASRFEARAYSMLPLSRWGTQYLAPRSSDGDYWLYNPGPADPLTVTAQTMTSTTTIDIPANSTARYIPDPGRTGVVFSAPSAFYGIAALDADAIQDWGYALLPVDCLTSQALIGWAPGNYRVPPSSYPTDQGRRASRVYVTALTPTTVYVDFEGDGTRIGTFPVSPLEEVYIVDTDDYDMTGARIYTAGEPFIAVWGQDEEAPIADPSIDVGTNIVPLQAPSIQKTYTLVEEGYNCGTVRRGHTVRFQLRAYNDSINPFNNVRVRDELEGEFSYLSGSTRVNGVQIDDSAGFPLEGGYTLVDPIPGMEIASITYDTVIEDAGVFNNWARFDSPDRIYPASVRGLLPFRVVGYEVIKTLVDPPGGTVDPGQVITFGVTISNTGTITITELPLVDRFNEDCDNCLTFLSASVMPDDIVPTEAITWNNLAPAPAGLPPGQQVPLTVSFRVADSLPPGVTDTTAYALSEGVRGSDGFAQAIVCDEASVSFAPPPAPPPEPDDDEDDGGVGAPPVPTPLPPPPPSVAAPTPAVLFLPETGVGNAKAGPNVWPLVALPGLGLLLGWMALRRLGK